MSAETVVCVTTEKPFVYWKSIDDLVSIHRQIRNDLTPAESRPSGIHFEMIELEAIERSHEQGEDRYRSGLCALYINKNSKDFAIQKIDLPEHLRWFYFRLTIDLPSDLLLAHVVVDVVDATADPIPFEDIVEFFDANPKVQSLNEHVESYNRLY